jgi:hypothetical protein
MKRSPPGTLLLDDRWLNQVGALLDTAARACERSEGRKPALEDLRQLLATILGGGGLERWFDDGDKREVRDVRFELAARKALPRRARPGDLLAIPLGKRRFGFARVMHEPGTPFIGVLVEPLRFTSPRPEPDPRIVSSGRLGAPVMINDREAIASGRWTIIASDASYRPTAADRAIELRSPHPSGGSWVARMPFHKSRRPRAIDEATARTLQYVATCACEELEKRLRAAKHR